MSSPTYTHQMASLSAEAYRVLLGPEQKAIGRKIKFFCHPPEPALSDCLADYVPPEATLIDMAIESFERKAVWPHAGQVLTAHGYFKRDRRYVSCVLRYYVRYQVAVLRYE